MAKLFSHFPGKEIYPGFKDTPGFKDAFLLQHLSIVKLKKKKKKDGVLCGSVGAKTTAGLRGRTI